MFLLLRVAVVLVQETLALVPQDKTAGVAVVQAA
jgi:hypothetical protein